jgi:hypothetical protein
MVYTHKTFSEVVRTGRTKWLKSGPAVPFKDNKNVIRLLLVEPMYWKYDCPLVREYKPRSWFPRNKRARAKKGTAMREL